MAEISLPSDLSDAPREAELRQIATVCNHVR